MWDDASERVQVSQPMSTTQTMVRNWTYDTSGRTASYADARGTTTYSYGAGNFLESVADPRGITLSFEYDNLGRRTRRYATSGGTTVDDQTFAFDLAGNMVSAAVVGSASIDVAYDDDARVWKTYQQSQTPTTTYGYDSSTGRLSSIADPAGTTGFTYTANGQLYQLTEPFSATPVTYTPVTYTYDTAGRITKRTDGGGLCWTQTYESSTGRADVRTIRVNGSNCNSTVLGTFDLGYDPASNVTSRAETIATETGANNADSGTWTYAYDGAGRMTSSTAPSTTVTTYGYDGAGNRTSMKVGAASPVTTSYDGAGLPTSSSDGTTYAHDAVGDLTQIDKPGGTTSDWNMVYDSWGNLKSAAHVAGSPDVSYGLDALDRVLSRTAGGTITSYTYRGTGEDAAKVHVGASTPVYYDFTPSGPLAQRTGTDPATLRYFLRDLHGDVVATAATSGTNRVKGSILYSPWGEPGTRTGEMGTSPAQGYLGFQGDLTDSLTGQIDMLTRYYEPSLGRFTKRDVLFGDPTDPVSLNQFVYSAGNAVTYTDPSGMYRAAAKTSGGPCDRACQAHANAEAAQVVLFNYVISSVPVSTFVEIMKNPHLPVQERMAAAQMVYAGYGKTGRDIVYQWSEAQQDAAESSTWSQITHHPWSSWSEGPAEWKWIGGALIVVGGGGLLCAYLSPGCAAALGAEGAGAGTAQRLSEEGAAGAAEASAGVAEASSRFFSVNTAGIARLYMPSSSGLVEIEEHAALRLAQRGISLDAVQTVLSQTPFPYFHEGVWKVGYYYSGTFVGTLNGVATTVINNVNRNYIDNLQALTP